MEQLLPQLLSGLGPVSLVTVIIVFWRIGLLKKNGNGNGHNKELIDRFDALESNHLHTLETSIEGLRRDLSEHASQEIQLLTRISVLLETYGK